MELPPTSRYYYFESISPFKKGVTKRAHKSGVIMVIIKTLKTFSIIGLFTSLFLVSLLETPGYPANMPLEIINIKPAGTGSPAIPSNHRIFYAYPGIEYKIRTAVIGGSYPYTYRLTNAPAGMTVDTSGYIRWPNPQMSAKDIELRVTDSNNNSVDTTWTITVQTSGFRFVDVNAGNNGNGSISSPYNSIVSMVAGASNSDIIIFRKGKYSLPARGGHTIGGASAFEFNRPSATSTRWLAYPGEEVVIDLQNNRYFFGEVSGQPLYFDGLTFYRGKEYFFRTSSRSTYVTFLDNTFDGLTLERTNYNSNQGTYFTSSLGTGSFLTFQGNIFRGYRGTQGIGSLYDQNKVLVENNYFYDFENANSTNQVLAFKIGITNLTLRGNVVSLSATSNFGIFGGVTNGPFMDGSSFGHGPKSRNIEILYNYFRHNGRGITELNRYSDQGTTWVHRNTFVSALQMTNLNAPSGCNGPWVISSNVFQNSNSGLSWHHTNSGDYKSCVSQSGDIGASSGVVDSNGLLTPSYSTHVGVSGWQFANGSTPMDRSQTSPNLAAPTPDVPTPDVPTPDVPTAQAPHAPTGLRLVR
jgi:hypothetical protein